METENPLAQRQPLPRSSIIPPQVRPRLFQARRPETDTSRKYFLYAVAKELGIDPNNLAGWLAKRKPEEESCMDGKKRLRTDLAFNFENRPVYLEGRVGLNSLLSETTIDTIRAYFSLRERIRNGELAAASTGFDHRKKTYLDFLREFVPPRVRLEKDPHTPLLFFAREQLPRFRVPVYELNGNFYCSPRHAEAIALAARMECASKSSKIRESNKVLQEAANFSNGREIPYELGLKLWVLRAHCLKPGVYMQDLKFSMTYSRTIQEFFHLAPQDYMSLSV